MKLVTVATDEVGYMPYLYESCKRHNTKLHVLGLGEKWQGFDWRLKLIKDFVQSQDPNEIICMIDAYDTVLLRPLEPLADALAELEKTKGISMIIGAENLQHPVLSIFPLFMFGTCNGMLLNAGTYVARAGSLSRILENIPYHRDDQVAFTKYCQQKPNDLYVDKDSKFFLTISSPLQQVHRKGIEITSSQELLFNGTRPFILHGNANSRMENILRGLGYTVSPSHEEKLLRFHLKAMWKKCVYYASFSYIYIVGIVAVVCIVKLLNKK
jgi:hypothetical protein